MPFVLIAMTKHQKEMNTDFKKYRRLLAPKDKAHTTQRLVGIRHHDTTPASANSLLRSYLREKSKQPQTLELLSDSLHKLLYSPLLNEFFGT